MKLILAALSAAFLLHGQTSSQVYNIPPVKTSIDVDGQHVEISASGTISSGAAKMPELALHLDLGDLQKQLTPVLAAELNRSEECDERLTVEHATLAPAAPSGILTVNVNYERYACAQAFGRQVAKKLVGGHGVVQVKLTPQVADNNISLDSELRKIDADGSLGKALKSDSLGDSLKQEIGDSIESAIQKLADTKATLPTAIQNAVSIQTIRFADAGSGRLSLEMTGEVRLPADQLRRAVGQ